MFAVLLLALLIAVPVRADLHDPSNSADYIILTNQDVLSNNTWIDSLLDYREAQGRTTMAVTVEEIWDEFTPDGSTEAVREFLHFAYDNWTAPRLKDVFIIGHVDVVPSFVTAEFARPEMFYNSDYKLTTLTPTEQAPRFRLGRLPWSPDSPNALPNYFAKIRSYETESAGQCGSTIQLIAGAFDGANNFESTSEGIANVFHDYELERDYVGREPGDPYYGNREEILANLSAGPFASFVSGYCSESFWLEADYIVPADLASLSNAPCFSIYGGLTSHDFDAAPGGSPMTSAVLSESGGAILAFGNTGECWAIAGQAFDLKFAQALLNTANENLGEVWENAIADYRETYFVDQEDSYLETLLSNVLLGDPATMIPSRTTDVSPITAPALPQSLSVVGNYPNPFNPTTTIRFQMNRAGLAKLTVYDITGRAVATLADQNFAAGVHSVNFNAAGLASGIYIVRLESAGEFAAHKLTLLK